MSGLSGAPPAMPNTINPFNYIGRSISIISKSQIRYEGVLSAIDINDNTITLHNVRTFGTEDRYRPEGYLPLLDSVCDYIVFRATDIIELQVASLQHHHPSWL